jgi:hypothetical protein
VLNASAIGFAALCGAAPSIGTRVVARVIQAAGAAFPMPTNEPAAAAAAASRMR